MSANVSPIFTNVPVLGWTAPALTTANAAVDGTGTVQTIATGGTNGSRIDKLICVPVGTNVVSALSVFLNNGLTAATPANNVLVKDIALPATTQSNAASMGPFEVQMDLPIPAGYKLNVAVRTTVAAGWHIIAVAGNY